MMLGSKGLGLTAILGAIVLTAACADQGPVGPAVATTLGSARSAFAANPGESEVTLCKFGPTGTTATFALSATTGTLLHGATITIAADPMDFEKACVMIWRSLVPGLTGSVTATEIAMTPGLELEFIRASAWDGEQTLMPPANSVTVNVTSTENAQIWFKNKDSFTPPPPPPPPVVGGEGCTPGYWKQSHHASSWTLPYRPTMRFSEVFENAFPGKTLQQVLGLGGGGLNALGRHAVAALLNSASTQVDYDMTTAEVIAAFNAAYPGGDYETLKNKLAGFNEQGCDIPKPPRDDRDCDEHGHGKWDRWKDAKDKWDRDRDERDREWKTRWHRWKNDRDRRAFHWRFDGGREWRW